MKYLLYVKGPTLALMAVALGLTSLGGCSLTRGGSLADRASGPATDMDNATDASEMDGGADSMVPASLDSGTPPDSGVKGVDPRDVVIGRYAERRAFRTIQRVMSPIFNDDVRVLTTSYSLVEVLRKGTSYVFRENACRVAIENEGSFTSLDVTIKDMVPQSIPQIESELQVENRGGSITWVRPITSAPVGFIPSNPNDTLPTTANDPRVRDSDGDGNPGVSAYVKASLFFGGVEGTLYLAQWNRARYAGTRRADGVLEGENFDTSEQNVIGSDNQMLANNNPPIIPDSDLADNRIILMPLTMPITCQTLLGQLDSLFP